MCLGNVRNHCHVDMLRLLRHDCSWEKTGQKGIDSHPGRLHQPQAQLRNVPKIQHIRSKTPQQCKRKSSSSHFNPYSNFLTSFGLGLLSWSPPLLNCCCCCCCCCSSSTIMVNFLHLTAPHSQPSLAGQMVGQSSGSCLSETPAAKVTHGPRAKSGILDGFSLLRSSRGYAKLLRFDEQQHVPSIDIPDIPLGNCLQNTPVTTPMAGTILLATRLAQFRMIRLWGRHIICTPPGK